LQSNGVHFFYATNKSWFLFYVLLGQVFNESLCVGGLGSLSSKSPLGQVFNEGLCVGGLGPLYRKRL